MRARFALALLTSTLLADAAWGQPSRLAITPDTSSLPVYTIHDTDKMQVRWSSTAPVSERAVGPQTIYSSLDNRLDPGFFAQNGGALSDDYTGAGADAATGLPLHSLQFEGGVTAPNNVAFFVFFNAAGTVQLGGFGFQFPTLGVQFWEFVDPTPQTPVLIDQSGILAVVAGRASDNASGLPTQVAWSQSAVPASIGSNQGAPGLGDGSRQTTVYGFAVNIVPAPGVASAMAALAGLSLCRRRRSLR